MKTKLPSKPDDPEQSKRFIETARKHEAAEDEEKARKTFIQVVKPKASPRPK